MVIILILLLSIFQGLGATSIPAPYQNGEQFFNAFKADAKYTFAADKQVYGDQATVLLLACCMHDDVDAIKKLGKAYYNATRPEIFLIGHLKECAVRSVMKRATPFSRFIADAYTMAQSSGAYKIQLFITKTFAPLMKLHALNSEQNKMKPSDQNDWFYCYATLQSDPNAYAFSQDAAGSRRELRCLGIIALLKNDVVGMNALAHSYLQSRWGKHGRNYERYMWPLMGKKTTFSNFLLQMDEVATLLGSEQIKRLLQREYAPRTSSAMAAIRSRL